MSPRLFTIGYEEATPPRLIASLRAAQVELVVDVRAIAGSRRPGFAKTALRAELEAAGIDYRHVPALGTPAEGRLAARTGKMEVMRSIFAARLAGVEGQAALAELASVSAHRPTALLCLEAQACRCHRALIADALVVEKGFKRVDLVP